MSQYKASMERMSRDDNNDKESSSIQKNTIKTITSQSIASEQLDPEEPSQRNDNEVSMVVTNPALKSLRKYSGFLMMPVIPLLWCILFLTTMNREMLLSAYAMPLLGICSASLANAVPVGGGIVFVPILSLIGGFQIKLGTAFAVATMTFGNGLFGFLTWLRKDPSSIVWSVVPYAVVPAWSAAWFGTMYPFLSGRQCRHLLAGFCFVVAIVVGRGIYLNRGVNYENGVASKKPFSIVNHTDNDKDDDTNINHCKSRQKFLASCFSFLAGLILVPHIGIGNAMTTFLVCTFIWKLPAKPSVVTGILVGGWTSVVPFVIHLIVLKDVPMALWIMGLPGVYLGARIAPHVHDTMGITNVLIAFVIFLFGAS
eukprot:CAMPEP_0184861020 /NCGR_PEP_ID=MMETSP0580-20130426/5795_1 /TAXON_ID=1118495 /ORGANISM="Dactyliosolen fragilissimus" /LENGTH=368 /DNA_ID=CAMNT_0027358345 /DNA_START=24 /DNA_END=1127 /DNA_ORIENTATION=-